MARGGLSSIRAPRGGFVSGESFLRKPIASTSALGGGNGHQPFLRMNSSMKSTSTCTWSTVTALYIDTRMPPRSR